ncbi:hypothetical protein PR048_002088 [Dryococelus australis]|uniref:Uncharacterized protein n=1 Tax=Dryococelus australis TaxID=614101 RepID=A0ABQ9IJ67_9NEOP|nr:hypothetical protein PR048_002088 [Dryococelus australis]
MLPFATKMSATDSGLLIVEKLVRRKSFSTWKFTMKFTATFGTSLRQYHNPEKSTSRGRNETIRFTHASSFSLIK